MKKLALLVVLLAAATASADEAMAPGTRVRVTGPSSVVVGSLLASDADGITIGARGRQRRLAAADVWQVEVSRKRGRRGRGALIGMGAGAVAGFVFGAATNSGGCDPSQGNFCLFGTEPLFSDAQSGVMGAVLGSGLGALVGAAVAPGERWEVVSRPRLRMTAAPVRGGAAAALIVRF